jgi:hypothetical protein
MNFLGHTEKSPSPHPPKNVMYFIMLSLLVHKIFTFYIKDAIKFKSPALGAKGLN